MYKGKGDCSIVKHDICKVKGNCNIHNTCVEPEVCGPMCIHQNTSTTSVQAHLLIIILLMLPDIIAHSSNRMYRGIGQSTWIRVVCKITSSSKHLVVFFPGAKMRKGKMCRKK